MTKHEYEVIGKIADRALVIAKKYDIPYRKIDALMDIEFANKAIPMNLEALLAADTFNFAHDVFGIREHFNRETLEMEDCFVPRFAL